MNSPSVPAGIELALLLGEALHRYGTPAHRLEDTLRRVCERLGLDARFLATPTALHASFGPVSQLQSSFIRVEPGEMDLEKLARLDEVTDGVVRGRTSAPEGALAVARIVSAPPRYGRLLTVVSYGLAAGAAARLLGGAEREMVVASFSSLLIGALAVLSTRLPSLTRILEAAGALVATCIAVLAAAYAGPVSVSIATVAGLVVLLPGLAMTVAMNELANQHLISGTSKLMGAALVFLKLGFGVALGSKLATFLPAAAEAFVPSRAPVSTAIALVVMTLAVSVLLKAQPRDFGYVALAGTLGYVAARWVTWAFTLELGAFFGAFVLGAVSNVLARLRNGPSVVTIVPGLILLVPGSVGFRSLESLLHRDIVAGVGTGFSMAMAVIALVAGLLFANALVPSRRAL